MKDKKVLIVALNWGLGHATRMIPVIKTLKQSGAIVLVGGSPQHLAIYFEEFPDIQPVTIPFLRIKLATGKSQLRQIVFQIPKILIQIVREHIALKKIVKQYQPDLILSDNCYGLFHSKVSSVFVTHQIFIKTPLKSTFVENLLNKVNHWFINRFNYCWVPDIESTKGLAGDLSHSSVYSNNLYFVGLLSRFTMDNHFSLKMGASNKMLILLSGPEPQRSILERMVEQEIIHFSQLYEFCIVRGLPAGEQNNLPTGWYNHLPTSVLEKTILEADFIICRSGYSTIMDLVTLGKTALLVPTPGQTEQEYLAEYLSENGLFTTLLQENFSLLKAITILQKFEVSPQKYDNYRNHKLLEKAIDNLIHTA